MVQSIFLAFQSISASPTLTRVSTPLFYYYYYWTYTLLSTRKHNSLRNM